MGEAGVNAEDDTFKLGIWLINKAGADISNTKTNTEYTLNILIKTQGIDAILLPGGRDCKIEILFSKNDENVYVNHVKVLGKYGDDFHERYEWYSGNNFNLENAIYILRRILLKSTTGVFKVSGPKEVPVPAGGAKASRVSCTPGGYIFNIIA